MSIRGYDHAKVMLFKNSYMGIIYCVTYASLYYLENM